MGEINKLDDPFRDKPFVYIWVTFGYRTTYKEFRMVANYKVLSETSEACAEILKKDSNYAQTVYYVTVNLAFRPRVLTQDLCNSVIRYICCSINVKETLKDYTKTGVKFCIHISVDDDEWAEVKCLPPEIYRKIGKIDPGFSLTENSELSMTLPSKFQFLSETEFKFLIGLFNKIHQSNKDIVIMTLGQLWDLIEREDSKEAETITADEMDQTINTLLFYDLIDIDTDDLNKHHFKLSIKNPPNYYDFLQQNDISLPVKKFSKEECKILKEYDSLSDKNKS